MEYHSRGGLSLPFASKLLTIMFPNHAWWKLYLKSCGGSWRNCSVYISSKPGMPPAMYQTKGCLSASTFGHRNVRSSYHTVTVKSWLEGSARREVKRAYWFNHILDFTLEERVSPRGVEADAKVAACGMWTWGFCESSWSTPVEVSTTTEIAPWISSSESVLGGRRVEGFSCLGRYHSGRAGMVLASGDIIPNYYSIPSWWRVLTTNVLLWRPPPLERHLRQEALIFQTYRHVKFRWFAASGLAWVDYSFPWCMWWLNRIGAFVTCPPGQRVDWRFGWGGITDAVIWSKSSTVGYNSYMVKLGPGGLTPGSSGTRIKWSLRLIRKHRYLCHKFWLIGWLHTNGVCSEPCHRYLMAVLYEKTLY